MKYSGFTFTHDCIRGGYPIREAVEAVRPYCSEIVAVDCESTDGTREVLESLGCRIVDGKWGTEAEKTLGAAHALHTACKNDTILAFEADEVWDLRLLNFCTSREMNDVVVYRIQVEQNFQRMRWAPHQVHRIFQRGKATKDPNRGHTTHQHDQVESVVPMEHGLIWDCTYCFRDNWADRAIQNAELWGEEVQLLRRTPEHFTYGPKADGPEFFQEPHWEWKTSPFALPEILKPLVGRTRYS